MKFRCEREVLVDALNTAGRAVSARGALPVLAGLRLELSGDNLVITGSDLDLTITVSIQVAGGDDGLSVVPAKLLSDVVRAVAPGAVEIESADGVVQIRAGRSDFSLRTIPADEYPQLPEVPGEGVTLDGAALEQALKQVVPAASSDDSRPILTGVLMAAEGDGLRLVATDSYRLAVRDLPGTSVLERSQQILVPSRALNELTRLIDADVPVTLKLGERDASFAVGDVRMTTRLIEGDFPNYRGLIPESNPNKLTIDRASLYEAVRRVRLLAQEATPLRLSMSSAGLELVATTQDVGEATEQVDANYEGAELTVAFNADYLAVGLDVAPGETVSLETVDELKPALLRSPEHPEFLYLLMPVRVPDAATPDVAVLDRLWITDFRNYRELDLGLGPGRVVFSGRNGQGKSNVLEAIGLCGSLTSFRGAPAEAMIRAGCEQAIVRAEATVGSRRLLIEVELVRGRASRVQVNKQRLTKRGDLTSLLPTTVFGPDDLELVKGGPGMRRGFIDDLLVQFHPANQRLRAELDRVLKQRNALLRSAGGRSSPDVESTLQVWNTKLSEVGDAWADLRSDLICRLAPRLDAAYRHLAGEHDHIRIDYRPDWRLAGLASALEAARRDELRRGVTLVGPHRDEIDLSVNDMAARSHASQGEQRTLALALRIAGHHELADVRETSPLLLLDDVFSELDDGRAGALLGLLAADQTFVTTAARTPEVSGSVQRFMVDGGQIRVDADE